MSRHLELGDIVIVTGLNKNQKREVVLSKVVTKFNIDFIRSIVEISENTIDGKIYVFDGERFVSHLEEC